MISLIKKVENLKLSLLKRSNFNYFFKIIFSYKCWKKIKKKGINLN